MCARACVVMTFIHYDLMSIVTLDASAFEHKGSIGV